MRSSDVSFVGAQLEAKDRTVALSPRETEVLTWAMQGKTNWEISVILSVSERTVKFHVRNAMTKLHSRSRAQAVAVALRFGLIGRDPSTSG